MRVFMKINHVASLLFMSKDDIEAAIKVGIKHPDTGDLIKLKAEKRGREYHISDEQADEFILAFYSKKDRNRYIPVPVRRELLIESSYQCGNCVTGFPLDIHHIIEHSTIQHNDPAHMIVCAKTVMANVLIT